MNNKLSKLYFYFCCSFLGFVLLCAIFSQYIASDLPYYAQVKGKSYYPLFQAENKDSFPDFRLKKIRFQSLSEVDWHKMKPEKVIWSLCRYSSKHLGNTKLQSPFGKQYAEDENGKKIEVCDNQRHILGTDATDRDVLACLVEGARGSLSISLGAIIIITLLGLSLGGAAGFFGDKKFWISVGEFLGIILGLFPAYFYGFYVWKWDFLGIDTQNAWGLLALSIIIRFSIFAGIVFLFYKIGKLLKIIPLFNKKRRLPIDKMLTFLTDIQQSVPSILLITLLSLSLPKGIGSMILIIGLLGIFGLARFSRTELARISQMPYIEAAQSLGFSTARLIFRHILPNFYPILIPILLLSIADIIILESSLSFLGIGLDFETVSWGRILSDARNDFSAWWLTLFPALALFFTVSSLYLIGEKLKNN